MLFALLVATLAADASAPVRVSLTASDGAVIVADDYGGGERGVVLAHGGRRTRSHWRPQARVLADVGFHVVAIDFRGFGESPRSEGAGERDLSYARDVLAAVRYLRDHGARTVSVVGGSFGGGAAAQAVVEAPRGTIDRLVLLAHSAIAEPECLFVRKLFITARGRPRR
jgi:pimeloyl-ACP methyl ester carboxylesterase